MDIDYTELHCISNFSFLRGASSPEELILQADALGYHSLAITDECSLAGVVRAHTAIKDHQLTTRLIVGAEFNINEQFFVVIIAPNRMAYGQLSALITLARRRCEKGSYQLDPNDLQQHLSECLLLWRPHIPDALATQETAEQQWHHNNQTLGNWLTQHFPQRLWLLYERHLNSDDSQQRQYFKTLSEQLTIPVVCAGNVSMHVPQRQRVSHVINAIRLGKTVQECGFALAANTEGAMRQLSKIVKLYPQDWIEQTMVIAERCQFDMASLGYEYPAELVPKGETPMSYLRTLVNRGQQFRFPNGTPASIQHTINKELILVEEQGYAHFFLTIHDIVMFAKSQGILYQGRGSAANSIVCYCLEITPVDPQKIHVLFERFISKERDEPPDIDVDFEHERREEVIQYIYRKYGRQRAALAATVITYRFKSAVREVGKALGIAEEQLSFFISNVDRRDNEIGWKTQLATLGMDEGSPMGKHFIELVEQIIGFPRHLSQHVGGFVISSGPLSELVPTENASMADRTVIQWDKDDLESLGLLKVDILALGMLSAIAKSFALIKQHYHRELTISAIIKEDDPAVYAMLQRADSVGVFQVESRAQTNMLPRLKPNCYYDLVIQIAIVRPGPIQGDMVHPYLRRRNGDEDIVYPSTEVEGVLSRTLGVPIFQEQVIQLAMVAAGFTGGEADQLRRAMASWKKNGQLQKFQKKLITGMTERGYELQFAERIYQQILGFGDYGFPEAHSASFAVLAYVSAWLKHYYPDVFCCALLNSQPMGFYSPSQLIQDARYHHVDIAPIDVNHSQWQHTLTPTATGKEHAIRLGFRLVKGLSKQGMKPLLQHRPIHGFEHIDDIVNLGLPKDALEALASADAFKAITGHRYQARWDIQGVAEPLPLFSSQDLTHQDDSQAITAPEEIDNILEDYTSTGLTLHKHPIQLLRERGRLGRTTLANQLQHQRSGSVISVVGVVVGKQRPATASGVTFVTLEDETGNINVVVWQATARAQKKAYLTAKILKVKGIIEKQGQVIHIMAGRLIDLSAELAELQSKSREFH